MPASINPPEPTPEEAFREDLAGWAAGLARNRRSGGWMTPTPPPYQLTVADSLDAFAAFVRALPVDDPRLLELARLAGLRGSYMPSGMMDDEMLHYNEAHLSPAGLLDRLVRIAWYKSERSPTAPPPDADQTDDTPTT